MRLISSKGIIYAKYDLISQHKKINDASNKFFNRETQISYQRFRDQSSEEKLASIEMSKAEKILGLLINQCIINNDDKDVNNIILL